MALAYLLCVVASLAALAVALRPRRVPAPTPAAPPPPPPAPAPAPAALPPVNEAEVRLILAAAVHLAARLDAAA